MQLGSMATKTVQGKDGPRSPANQTRIARVFVVLVTDLAVHSCFAQET